MLLGEADVMARSKEGSAMEVVVVDTLECRKWLK